MIQLYLIKLAGAILKVSQNIPDKKDTSQEYPINTGADEVPFLVGTVFDYVSIIRSNVTLACHYCKAPAHRTGTGD